ncbi:hypothetical protein NL676_013885 [Syzygium grande]|nr:hypothetical protein NL676_013885 [Syzygium grande]
MLQERLPPLLQEHKPDCLVADMFFPWATDVATECDESPRVVLEAVNFHELEKDCVDYYRNASGRQARRVGPISLRNEDMEDEALRGKEACLTWLDSKEPNSVVYACFGGEANYISQQLMEIASGLEASEQTFI